MVVLSLLNVKFLAHAAICDFRPNQVVSLADGYGEGYGVGDFFSIQVQFGPKGSVDR